MDKQIEIPKSEYNVHAADSQRDDSIATDATIADARKIILHISNSNPTRLKAALDETEGLLNNYKRANRNIQVEVIANKQGVDLLRTNFSPYKERISLMQEKYPNLSFMVCGQTINKLKNEGNKVELLPHTGVATSAADQINKRLHQGGAMSRFSMFSLEFILIRQKSTSYFKTPINTRVRCHALLLSKLE